MYTLCHRRTKGSYSLSLCQPDSSWTKYRHRGLAHRLVGSLHPHRRLYGDNAQISVKVLVSLLRLIQFPPPPLKGGITVTMEDLQCLDSGQFLNDVIIDFYLKSVTSPQSLQRCVNERRRGVEASAGVLLQTRYLLHKAAAAVTERCHIFSSFFFKQLTRRDNASEGSAKDS